ncbi:MAG: hypothetical protein GXY63_07635, partial [Spirochaetales bacterium]|nr:hypothetical protein [Spirochaetales bacterium]
MMTIRKLASMKGRSRLRKIALLFRQCSVSGCDPHYLASLVALAEETVGEVLDSDYDTAFLTHLIDGTHEGDRLSLALLDAYYLLSAALGETVADWDWEDEEGALD